MRGMIERTAMVFLVLCLCLTLGVPGWAKEEDVRGPHSTQAIGEKRVLITVVRFPDAEPTTPLEQLKKRAVNSLNAYIKEQSYGLSSIKADFRGYVMLPDSLSRYKLSPYNFKVDRNRVRKLVEDTMTALENDVDFSRYDHIFVLPAVHTTPGKGYGMICYCANPGMLSGVSKKNTPRYETLRSKGDREFRGGVFVSAENAHLGMLAHDYLHALGGIYKGKRLVPCLYDFDRQSDASAGNPSFENHAVFMGYWDIMSQHFVKQGDPPPGLSSFTKIRLGWIKAEQVRAAEPGGSASAFLAPLSKGGNLLTVKIPLKDGTYYLVENRQPIGYDRVLPDSGLLVLKVEPDAMEGYGTVKVMMASSDVQGFANVPLRLDVEKRNCFTDKDNNIAIIPLWKKGDAVGVLVTTPDRSAAALKAAKAIDSLMARQSSQGGLQKRITEATAAFWEFDFEKSYAAAVR